MPRTTVACRGSFNGARLMGLFVAVGQQALRIASKDGVAWTHEEIGKEGETLRAVAYGNGIFAAVGGFGWGDQLMAYSRDGLDWHITPKTKQTNYRSLFFGQGKFLAMSGDPGQVGDAKPVVAVSTDGIAWSEPKRISGQWLIRRLAFGNGVFVGVGDRGRRSVSPDGLEWQDVPGTKAVDTLIDVAFGSGVFVGVGMHGLRTHSRDGLLWSEPERGLEGEHLNSVVWARDHFVAVGAGATWLSADGAKWNRVPNQDAPLTCLFGVGAILGANWKGRILRSPDGVAWTQVHKCAQHVEGLAFGAV